ncbi:extracellular solute-binding protein [Cohnella phaseoli]|uniref:Putative aldouronate transport system substrate-binding protein n=1 Tax=Cohnella phaseoli TaxID=456490 RepID=A0A3D9KG82_9BACL|nr:extracellular solute-binding protein [Cohnella phaseoli]RED85475.1 putative aldouronate transport system substrate-binding protein [Cohnella phaseoli]
MQKYGRKFPHILAFSLFVALLSACSGNNGNGSESQPATLQSFPSATSKSEETASPAGPDTSAEVKLKMVLIGDGAPDVKEVYGELNKKLKQDINATVDVQFLSWADWFQKYQLLFSTGDDFDLIITATWAQFADNARKGAFYEMTPEALQKFAPRSLAENPPEVLEAGKVEGKQYALPMNYHEITINGYVVRGDLMDKYGIASIDSIDDFEKYLDAVVKNEKGLVPWEGTNYDNWIIAKTQLEEQREQYQPGNLGLRVNLNDPAAKLIDDIANPDQDAIDLYRKMAEWNKKGYISKNALVNKVTSKDSFLSGKSAAFLTNLLEANATYQTVKANHPEWDVRFYPANTTKKVVANSFMANAMAINAKSKNPERALMLLDLLRNDEWYNQTTTFGIKGKHWDASADGKLVLLPASQGYPPDAACPWGWRNTKFYLSPSDGLSNYDEVLASYRERVVNTKLNNFAPNLETTKSLQAALKEVENQYELPLRLGFVRGDVESSYQTMIDKKKAAGQETLIEDIQRQLNAFLGQ